MKEIRQCKQMKRYTIFLDWKSQYSENDLYLKQSINSMQSLLNYLQYFFHKTRTNNFIICMETQKTPKSQSNLEKEEWNYRNQPSWLQIKLQSHSHEDSMALAQKQKYRPMEQDRKSEDKSMHPWAPCLWQRRQKFTIEKRVSSTSGARKNGQLHVKEWSQYTS